MPIEFQRVTIKDAQTLLDIEKTATSLKTYSAYLTGEEIKDCINNNVVYFIKRDNKIAGSISYKIKNKNRAYQIGLIIKPEFQRQGLAKQALKKLLNKLKNFKIIDLVVHPDNVFALKPYKSFGFIVKNRKENYYDDGEPRLIMVLKK
ncbi:MAG: N-acetyltransferase [Patescibacteria group bacterium]